MSSRAAGRCCAFVLAIAVGSQARGAAALESEPIALTLQFEGTAPCFTSAELATTIAERIGRPVANDAVDAQLALHVSVRQSGGSGFEVTIESRARDATEIGQRELTVAGGCDALAAPLSLVIALMVGSADAPQPPAVAPEAPATTPPPAPPAPTAPAVPPPAAPSPAKPATPAPLPRAPRADEPRSAGEGDPSSRFVLGLMGGADLSMVSETTRVIGVAARFEFGARAQSGALTRGAWEGAVEFLSSPEFDRGEWRASVDGAGAHGSLCGIWGPSWLAVEPCVGLWLRTLGVRGEGAAAELFEPSRETLFGWSTRAMLRSDVIGPWSVFGGIQALVPFGQHELSMSESERPPSQEAPGLDPPFFNMGMADRDPLQPAPTEPVRFELYEVPILAVVLLAGVTFTLP